MVFLTFRSDRLLQNYEITLKVSGNPESASKFLILASNLDYLMIILGPKMGIIVHKVSRIPKMSQNLKFNL